MRKKDRAVWARALCLLEAGNTRAVQARNAQGKPVNMFAKTAVHFCAGGAMMRAMVDLIHSESGQDRFLKKYRAEIAMLVWFWERGRKDLVMMVFKMRAQEFTRHGAPRNREVCA